MLNGWQGNVLLWSPIICCERFVHNVTQYGASGAMQRSSQHYTAVRIVKLYYLTTSSSREISGLGCEEVIIVNQTRM